MGNEISYTFLSKTQSPGADWLCFGSHHITIGILFPDPKFPFRSFIRIFGFILIISGLWLHGLSYKVHKQAHQKTEKIEKLVTTGIYNKIRHPGGGLGDAGPIHD